MPVYTTKTQIANKALSMLGQKSIADLAAVDPNNKVLVALQDNYDLAVEQVIRDCKIELTAFFFQLTKILDNPTREWKYAFYLPPSYLQFRRIFSGIYPDSIDTEIRHRKLPVNSAAALEITGASQSTKCELQVTDASDGQIVNIADVVGMTELNGNTYYLSDVTDSTALLRSLEDGSYIDSSAFTPYVSDGTATPVAHHRILADCLEAFVEVGAIPDISIWPSDFAIAVATKLACLAGIPIVGIDHADFVAKVEEDYKTAKKNAEANSSTESFKGQRQLSSSTAARFGRRRRC